MSTDYGAAIFTQHAAMLAASGITPDHARARGYCSVDTKVRLDQLGVTKAGRRVPGLLVPSLRADGSVWGYQFRPDSPRLRDGRPVKYESPSGQRNGIDVPPGVGPMLGDPAVPLWVTEGVKKSDAGALAGLCIVALPGVWSWRGRNDAGGKVAVGDWHDVALNDRRVILAFDGDVSRKRAVRSALDALGKYLASKGAAVEYLHLPDTADKTGLDDYLAAGHTVEDLHRLVRPEPPAVVAPDDVQRANALASSPADHVSHGQVDRGQGGVEPVSLEEANAAFRRWLGEDYDLDALHTMLAAAAVERLDGDPLWVLVVSGSGNAKTETVQALTGAGAAVVSTITSDGALLSATAQRERTRDATGGLLRELGDRGVLVVKDVTSILSMNRDLRGQVLGALREVHDGGWTRKVGTDGGKSLHWSGRIAVVGAVTTAWDQAHSVIASMGDRFVLLRMDSSTGRQAAGRKAIGNTGAEVAMRAELSAVVAGVLAGMGASDTVLTDAETDLLLAAADLVTLARTGVEYDYRGDVIDAHAPEMPTRFAKQLAQVVRGAVAVGLDRLDALRLAMRCARDSMPPLRLAIIEDLAEHPGSSTADVRQRLNKPRATVDRQLQALHMLGVVEVDEVPIGQGTRWHHALADGIEPSALDPQELPEKSPPTPNPLEEEGRQGQADTARVPPDISGNSPAGCLHCGKQLAPLLIENGYTAHPSCAEDAAS